ncbi:MAG: alpha/beta fold hydrolase [Chloroflexi bacterium]|nr:alpha/beta fold hydrolase [Chloroflexota bacterium]
MATIILDDLTLFHDISGSGEPIVLLHAGICDHRMWDPQWPHITQRYHAVRLDLPGFGRSTLPSAAFAQHDVVLRLMDHLGINRAVLIGASFGGGVALDVALVAPDRVRGLILAAPAVNGAVLGPEVEAFGDQEDALIDSGDLDGAARSQRRFLACRVAPRGGGCRSRTATGRFQHAARVIRRARS